MPRFQGPDPRWFSLDINELGVIKSASSSQSSGDCSGEFVAIPCAIERRAASLSARTKIVRRRLVGLRFVSVIARLWVPFVQDEDAHHFVPLSRHRKR